MTLKKMKRHSNSVSCGSYGYEAPIVHRDNKGDYNRSNGGGSGGGYKMRVPSLKRNLAIWRNFYRLYPRLLEHLKGGDWYEQTEKDGVIIVKNHRIHNGNDRIKTIKFKKIWA